MISLRQHAISLAAVFLALAIGVVLGSNSLSDGLMSGLKDDKPELQNRINSLEDEGNGLREQLNSSDGFDAAIAGRTLRDTLAQRTVVIITTPDTDPGDYDALRSFIAQGGGEVTGRVSLTDTFVDVDNGDRLKGVVTNVIPAGVQLRTGNIDQGSLAGDLLGSVLLLDAQSAQPQSTPEELTLALQTLRSGGFVAYDDGGVRPAQLALVLSGGTAGPDGGNKAAVVARFAAALDTRGAGAVLAGRTGSASGTGAVAVARADTGISATLSTVDNVDISAGRITSVLALQEQLGNGAGRYGTGQGAGAVTAGAPPS